MSLLDYSTFLEQCIGIYIELDASLTDGGFFFNIWQSHSSFTNFQESHPFYSSSVKMPSFQPQSTKANAASLRASRTKKGMATQSMKKNIAANMRSANISSSVQNEKSWLGSYASCTIM